jgi:hypothetical protein
MRKKSQETEQPNIHGYILLLIIIALLTAITVNATVYGIPTI